MRAAAVVAVGGGAAEVAFRADTLTMDPAAITADMPALKPATKSRPAATALEAVAVVGGGAGGAAFRAAKTMAATG